MTRNEILNVVEKLNSAVGAGIDLDDMELIYPFFVFDTDGFSERITFAGIQLWSSDDDCREYDGQADRYEDLYEFLIKQIATLALEVSKVVMLIDAVDKAKPVAAPASASLN